MSAQEYHVQAQEAGQRADAYLAKVSGLTRSRVANLMEQGCIQRQGKAAKPGERVKEGDCFTVHIPQAQTLDLQPQDLQLDIVYQDAYLAVVNKPRGMVVHPGAGVQHGTMVNGLLYALDHLSGINGAVRPGIVHRLDKDTTGLLLVAKNDQAHQALSEAIQRREVKREYLALVAGNLVGDVGVVDAPIGRNPRERKQMAVVANGRAARTHYRVLHRFGDATLLVCTLDTGRTHQIRVHMAHIQHPVLGDPVYGPKKERAHAKGQLLHAFRITFMHPHTHERMCFCALLPPDYDAALRRRGLQLAIDSIQNA